MASFFSIQHHLVLVGGGHSHVDVLRVWAREPVPRVRLSVVTDSPPAVYSGVVPGLVAGQCRLEDLEIDVERLARRAGAAWFLNLQVDSGPGFFKAAALALVATDVLAGLAVDIRCDADVLPFRSGSVGAIVMMDALHHLPRPLDFLAEAERALTPGGRLAMVEPWITLPSWILYRFFHHEECRLGVDVARPFAFTRPLPVALQRVAQAGERALAPLARWLATRIFVVLEKPA